MGAADSRNIAATVLRSAGGGRGCREEPRGYRDGYVVAAHPLAEGPRCRGSSGRRRPRVVVVIEVSVVVVVVVCVVVVIVVSVVVVYSTCEVPLHVGRAQNLLMGTV